MNVNKVLRQIAYNVYKKRAVLPQNQRTNYRIEHVNGGLLCDLWFLTVGCIHDACGGCVMCNYGKGSGQIDYAEIVAELRRIVDRLPWEFEDFLLTPSGSMLDSREVPCNMREELIDILKNVKAKRFIIETRADSIDDSGIEFVKKIMPNSEKYIEIGLESSDDWVLKHCINKAMTFQDFKIAVKKIHENEIYVTANIGLGYPFMSERAAIKYAIISVKDAMNAGADSIVLFPYHIKKGTVLDIMYQNGMYKPVSLWALVEVLGYFTEEELQNIQISWYKDYFGMERSYIYHSPKTCLKCEKKIMELLDQYRDGQEYICIKELQNFSCECRTKWRNRLVHQSEDIEVDKVKDLYIKLAQIYNIESDVYGSEISNMYKEFMRR